MNERIKKIRKSNHLTQTELATTLGLTKSMVAQVETKKAVFSERTIKYFCHLYGVNENWLKTGEGQPYIEKNKNQEIAEFLNNALELDDDDFKKQLLLTLSRLDESEWAVLASMANIIIKNAD